MLAVAVGASDRAVRGVRRGLQGRGDAFSAPGRRMRFGTRVVMLPREPRTQG